MTYTEFGGIHDYNKTKSYDGKGTKTFYDSVKRTTQNNNTNDNNNNNYYTTNGFKYDFIDFNKITNENRKHLKEEEVIIFLNNIYLIGQKISNNIS